MTAFVLALSLLSSQTAAAQNGMLQPGSATYTVAVSGGTVTIPVTRVAGSSGSVGCSYATVDGTAHAGVDYVSKSGTLSWSDNDSAAKNVVITILDDGVVNGNKVFYLQLTLPTGGAFLGVPPTTPATNHEGRVLGTTPSFTTPVDWNDPTGAADNILQTLQILPANNPWNEDISGLPVSPDSDSIVAFMGASKPLHVNRDMNLTIVPGTQATKSVTLQLYGTESDPGPYPIPDNTPIEGYLGDDVFDAGRTRSLSEIQQDINPHLGGDRHATVIDPVNGYLYEFGNTVRDAGFNWTASGEATFNMNSNTTRQAGWTSTDAAGLPILPSIVRYDEVQRGVVEHALRVTAHASRASYVWPATHKTGSNAGTQYPRMGERFRLKNSANVNTIINTQFTGHPHAKAVALALQKYGMFMADNGSDWYISTNSDPRIDFTNLDLFVGSDFEVVVTTGPNEGPRATSTASITVTDGGGGGGGDSTPPTLSITAPTTATTYSTSSASLDVMGSAADNVGVTSVTWTNSAGGSGTASGTTSWNAPLTLAVGVNSLTFTAHDAGGNNSSKVLTVTYTPAPAGGGGTGGGGGGGGGCGLLGLELLPLALLGKIRRHA